MLYFLNVTDSSVVRNLRANAASATSVGVMWEKSLCPYGIIDGYMLYYQEVDNNMSFRSAFTPNFMANVENLLPFTNYIIQVQAISQSNNSQLLGEITSTTVVTLSGTDKDFTPTVPAFGSSRMYTITDPLLITTGRVM